MNLSELREAIRVKTGYPERGNAGTLRINNVLNQALRKLWGEIPEVLLREEHRIELEPPRTFTVVLDVSVSTERRVLTVHSSSTPFTAAVRFCLLDVLNGSLEIGGITAKLQK